MHTVPNAVIDVRRRTACSKLPSHVPILEDGMWANSAPSHRPLPLEPVVCPVPPWGLSHSDTIASDRAENLSELGRTSGDDDLV